jgi:hypothetical protein
MIILSRKTTSGTGKVYKNGLKIIPSMPHREAAITTKNGANLVIFYIWIKSGKVR